MISSGAEFSEFSGKVLVDNGKLFPSRNGKLSEKREIFLSFWSQFRWRYWSYPSFHPSNSLWIVSEVECTEEIQKASTIMFCMF